MAVSHALLNTPCSSCHVPPRPCWSSCWGIRSWWHSPGRSSLRRTRTRRCCTSRARSRQLGRLCPRSAAPCSHRRTRNGHECTFRARCRCSVVRSQGHPLRARGACVVVRRRAGAAWQGKMAPKAPAHGARSHAHMYANIPASATELAAQAPSSASANKTARAIAALTVASACRRCSGSFIKYNSVNTEHVIGCSRAGNNSVESLCAVAKRLFVWCWRAVLHAQEESKRLQWALPTVHSNVCQFPRRSSLLAARAATCTHTVSHVSQRSTGSHPWVAA